MALRRQKRGTGCLSERRALLKICFFSVQFSASANRRHGQLFFVVLFCLCLTSVSRHQNCLQIGYLSIDNFSLLTDSLSLQQCSFKAFIVIFSPLAGFTTMASSFLSTKILKKSKTRLSLLGFLAFISTYKPLSSTKPAMRLFLRQRLLSSLPLAFSRLWGHKPPCAFYDKQRQLEISPP